MKIRIRLNGTDLSQILYECLSCGESLSGYNGNLFHPTEMFGLLKTRKSTCQFAGKRFNDPLVFDVEEIQ